MNLCKTIERYANAVSSFDHWHDFGDKEQATEAAKKAVALQDRIDVLIAQAEAAEAYANWMIDDADPLSISLEKYCEGERLCRAYVAAREAVRKLEEGT